MGVMSVGCLGKHKSVPARLTHSVVRRPVALLRSPSL